MGLLSLALLSAAALSPQPSTPPNVLVVLVDDLGVDSVPSYGVGTDLPVMPTLDSLAQNGVLFRNAWTYPVCSPARASIQTGRYPFRHGVGFLVDSVQTQISLPFSEITIPEMLDLGAAGYSHAAIGKWHMNRTDTTYEGVYGLSPNNHGYSHFEGTLANILLPFTYYSWPKTTNGSSSVSLTYATTDQVDSAINWIQAAPEPWFCYVALSAAHTPYHTPPHGLYSEDLTGLTPATSPRQFFKAMVEAADSELGRLIASLGPLEPNTVVVVMSDNGSETLHVVPPFDPTHSKPTSYEGNLNIPFIVSGPVVAAPGTESAALVNLVDVFATVAELAGVDTGLVMPTVTLDSRSLVPVLNGTVSDTDFREVNYSEGFDPNGWGPTRSLHVARNARYKLIRDTYASPTLTEEFFDLVADPYEQSDLLLGTLSAAEQAAYDVLSAELDQLPSPCLRFGSGIAAQGSLPPDLATSACPTLGAGFTIDVTGGLAAAAGALYVGSTQLTSYSLGGFIFLDPLNAFGLPLTLDAAGSAQLPALLTDPGLLGLQLWLQGFFADAGATAGLAMTNGLRLTVQ